MDKEKRDYFQEWRLKIIARLGSCCAKCGGTDKLEFDHIDESLKTFNISKKWGSFIDENNEENQKLLSKELENCQLLCYGCHKDKTKPFMANLMSGFTHGSSYAWMKMGCRCELCLERKISDQAKRNEKRRASDVGRGQYNLSAECGTRNKYWRGCRCVLCKAGNAEAETLRKQRIKSEKSRSV